MAEPTSTNAGATPGGTSLDKSSPGAQRAKQESKNDRPSVWEIYFPKRNLAHREAVYIASFPEIVYFWPLVLISLFCAFLQGVIGLGEVTTGWIWVAVALFNMLVLVQDFDQKQFFIVLLLVVVSILGIWLVNLYGFSFFKSLANWLMSFQPTLSTDAYLVIGLVSAVFFAWGMVSPLFNYWRIEQNEFVHFTQPIGRDMSIARLGCTVFKDIPDIIECMLTGGGGTLMIKKENQIIASIPNIPFLGLRMESIEHVLSETRVVVSTEQPL